MSILVYGVGQTIDNSAYRTVDSCGDASNPVCAYIVLTKKIWNWFIQEKCFISQGYEGVITALEKLISD